MPILQYYDAGIPIGDKNLPFGMRLHQDDGHGGSDHIDIFVEDQAATDYANVVLNIDSIGSFKVTDSGQRTINQDVSPIVGIAPGNMFEWTDGPEMDGEDWRYKYVTTFETLTLKGGGVNLIDATTIKPDPLVSTMYTVTVGIKPTVETAQNAVVVNSVAPVSKSQDVEIIVIPRIKYMLTNVTSSDGPTPTNADTDEYYYYTIKALGKDYIAKLSAAQGYQLPTEIQVLDNNGNPITTQVEYDPVTGIIIIPADLLIGTVTIRAAGVAKKYSIAFYRQNTLGEKPEKIDGGSYESGEDISDLVIPAAPADIPGYDFEWDWGDWNPNNPATNDGQPERMPNQSIVVIGTFVPKSYTLTVNYYKAGTTEELRESDTVQVPYTTTYTVNAPEISGYLAENLTLDVTMDQIGGKTVTIYYTATAGKLNIIYQYSNGKYPSETVTKDISTGVLCEVETPVVDGYTADKSVVSVTPEGTQAEDGITVIVIYTPNTYTVNFEANGGTVIPGSMLVEYDNVYNYDASSKTMVGLPTPVWPGYTFGQLVNIDDKDDLETVYWYIDSNGNGKYEVGEEVDGADAVKGDATLIALWTVNTGRVLLRFVDEDGNILRADMVCTGEIGESVTVVTFPTALTVDGVNYTTETTSVSFTYMVQAQVIRIVYVSENKTYDLTIYYQYSDGIEAAPTYSAALKEGETYDVKSPVVDGYTPSQAMVSGTMGTKAVTITIYYTPENQEDVVSVTVTWGELVFTYDYGVWNPENHQYDHPDIQPKTNLENHVTVNNNPESNVAVNVAVVYTDTRGHENLTGYFTETNGRYSNRITQWDLSPGTGRQVFFWLEGYMDPGEAGTITSGTCTVTITPAGG